LLPCPPRSVLKAYSYLTRDAVFAYDTPPGKVQPDPVALARQAALARTAEEQAAERQAAVAAAEAAASPAAPLTAGARQEQQQQKEGGAGNEGREGKGAAGGKGQPDQKQQQQQQQGAPRRRSRRLAAADAAEEELPAPGSYSAALLRTFEPGAAAAAHAAVRRLKKDLMRHNAEVARQFMRGVVERAAAAEAPPADNPGGSK
jgi:hypothetical protein